MRRFAVIIVVAVCVVGACSSGGSKSAATTTTAAGGSSSSQSGGTVGAATSDCVAAGEALAAAGDAQGSGSGKLKDQALKARDSLRALQSSISDGDTKDALGVLANAYNDYANALGDSDYDPSKGDAPPAAVIAAVQVFARPEFAQAAGKLSQFFATGCHA